MIYTIEELPDVALQNKAGAFIIFAYFSNSIFQKLNPFMCAITDTARKGGRDKGRLENWVYNRKYSVMQYPITDKSFVNMALFRIMNIKTGIRTVFVGFIFQFTIKRKNMFLQIPFKYLHIGLLPLI